MRTVCGVCTFLLFLGLSNVRGQAQLASGNIGGTVRDLLGARISGAVVSVTNSDTGLERRAVTDEAGRYGFLRLAPGRYVLVWSYPGFATERLADVGLRVGQSLERDAVLRPEGAGEVVVVRAPVGTLERSRAEQGGVIDSSEITGLPIGERNYLSFALLMPGIADAPALDSSLPQAPTSGLSFAGQGGRSNSVTIDGVDHGDAVSGAVRATLGQSAVREFQINRSNYDAEIGRAAGGHIDIVSSSGTNRRSGSAFGFFRHQSLDARNPFAFGPEGSRIDPPFSRLQAGGTLSGPVVTDRSFFFVSYEGLRQRESRFSTFLEGDLFGPTDSQTRLIEALEDVSDPAARRLGTSLRNALTSSAERYPETLRLLENDSGIFPFERDRHQSFIRLDQQSDRGQRLFRAAFARSDVAGDSPGGLDGHSHGSDSAILDWSLTYGDTRFGSATALGDLRVQFAGRTFGARPVDPVGPEITIQGTARVGRDYFLPSVHDEKRVLASKTVTRIYGPHEMKAGAEMQHSWFQAATQVFFGGRFVFGESVPLSEVIEQIEQMEEIEEVDLIGPGGAQGLADALARAGRSDLESNLSEPITPLQAFNFGRPLLYQQGFGDPHSRLSQTVVAGFLQDRFGLASDLTITAGLRYEAELHPSPMPRDWNNLAPRVGLAYSPEPRTVVRGGYGLYYAPVLQAVAFIARSLDPRRISQVFLSGGGPGIDAAAVWSVVEGRGELGARPVTREDLGRLGLEPGETPAVLFGVSGDLANPYSQHASLGLEHAWTADLTTEAAYLFQHAVGLLRSRNRNLRIVGSNAFGPAFGPIDPAVLQDNRIESTGHSVYHGLTVSLRLRALRGSELRLSYTLAKTIDDTTDFLSDLQPANQLDLAGERALSSFDQRHRLAIAGMFVLPPRLGSFTVAAVATVASPRPFNLLLGFDANGDTNPSTDRPPGAGRNTGRGAGFRSLDVRLGRTLQLSDTLRVEVLAEAFNVLNSVNYRKVNNVVGTLPLSSFRVRGDASLFPAEPLAFTSAFEPRQVQLGFRLLF